MKLLWFLLLTALLPASSTAQETGRLDFAYERFQLENGLDVVLHRTTATPFASVFTSYEVGGGDDPEHLTGFAHLFEHLMHKYDEIEDLVEVGGGAVAMTDHDRTLYTMWGAKHALARMLAIDAHRMVNLLDRITPEDFDIERDVVKNERWERYDTRAYGNARLLIDRALFPQGHPYHTPTIGSIRDIDAASYSDVETFYRTFYGPNVATLIVMGDIDLQETRRLIEQFYGPIPPIAPPARASASTLSAYDERGEARIAYEDPLASSPRLYIQWRTVPAFHPAEAPLQAIVDLLDNRETGWLRKRLVDDLGVASGVWASYELRDHASSLQIIATPREGRTLDEVLVAVDSEVSRMKAGPTEQDVTQFVRTNETLWLATLQGAGNRATALERYTRLLGLPGYFETTRLQYRGLMPQDLSDAALTYLTDDRRVVLSLVPAGQTDRAVSGSTFVTSD
ncbi:MAG: pitrilysin family protein [Bacteroidota bacterium]